MNQAGRTNTAGKKLRVNPDVSADIYNDSALKQDLPEQLSLPAISVGLVSGVKRPIDRKGIFIDLISNAL
jgi:hypothetical protein